MLILLLASVLTKAIVVADPASDQLSDFKNRTLGPIGLLTTSNGCPVEERDTTVLNSRLMTNRYFMETLSGVLRARRPERVLHAKGAGAFGYFEVTHEITDVCKADLFSEIGKITPVAVRFSETGLDKGEPGSVRDSRGFAIKFYTKQGIFDLVSFHTPMFSFREPFHFISLWRAIRRNPVTNLRDRNMLFDFLTLRPEVVFFSMYLFRDRGIIDTYRNMPGYSCHTYQVINKDNKPFFVRFHIHPEGGTKFLNSKQAAEKACSDPDYANRDLYNAIKNGNFPSWNISLQVLSYEDVKKSEQDVFDITQILPVDKYPLRTVGKLVLNRNPKNYFAEVEQMAFCVSNLVPGVMGAPDETFEVRRMAYRSAQLYRLGSGFDKIRVNCPFSNVYSYNRDGRAPIGGNGGESPNYYPNSFHGPVPYDDESYPKLIRVKQSQSYDFRQARDMYVNEMSEDERRSMVENIVAALADVNYKIQQRVVKMYTIVHHDFGFKLATALASAGKKRSN